LWKLYLISLSFADLPSLPLIHHYQIFPPPPMSIFFSNTQRLLFFL
jgi:hypothetical protein